MALAQHFANPANALVVRLSEKLREHNKLTEIGYGTIIAFIFLGAGFAVMSQIESMHHHVIYETDVSFELTAPPPEIAPTKKPRISAPVMEKHAALAAAPIVRAQPIAVAAGGKVDRATPSAITAKVDTTAAKAPASTPSLALTAASTAQAVAPTAACAMPNRTAAQTSLPAQPAPANNSVQLTPDMTAIAGGDFGAQRMTAAIASAPRMGNIKPYKLDLIAKIYEKWHPPSAETGNIVLEISIAHDGSVLANKIVQSSGDKSVDNDLLAIIGKTQFAPLPEWYTGEKLTWKLDLRTTRS